MDICNNRQFYDGELNSKSNICAGYISNAKSEPGICNGDSGRPGKIGTQRQLSQDGEGWRASPDLPNLKVLAKFPRENSTRSLQELFHRDGKLFSGYKLENMAAEILLASFLL